MQLHGHSGALDSFALDINPQPLNGIKWWLCLVNSVSLALVMLSIVMFRVGCIMSEHGRVSIILMPSPCWKTTAMLDWVLSAWITNNRSVCGSIRELGTLPALHRWEQISYDWWYGGYLYKWGGFLVHNPSCGENHRCQWAHSKMHCGHLVIQGHGIFLDTGCRCCAL